MSSYVNRSDAVVALKSFGRRYTELISGPVGDDAWDRLVRTPGVEGKSAVDYVVNAIEQLNSFTSLAALVPKSADAPKSMGAHSIAELQAMVKSVSAAAALALDERRDEDYERDMGVNQSTSLGHVASDLVTTLGANLRLGEAAIEAAR